MKDKTTTLHFSSLTQLATFLKKVSPKSYLINTLQLSLSAQLNELEIAIAVDQFSAEVPQIAVSV